MSKDNSSQEYLDLKTELRSILISSPQGCSEQQLLKDYAVYNGRKEIPFRQMGYANLQELLASMPDVANIDYNKNPVIIHGVADQHTMHIKKLVMAQKRKKPARTSRAPVNRYSGYNPRIPFNAPMTYPKSRAQATGFINNGVPHQPFHQIQNTTRSPWDTRGLSNGPVPSPYLSSAINNMNLNSTHQTLIGTNQTSTNKMVASFPPKSTPTPTPLMAGQTDAPDLMTVQITPTMDDNASVVDDDSYYSEDEELASYDAQLASKHGENIVLLRRRIRQLLLKFTNGLWLSNIQKLYNKTFNEELNLDDYKLKNLMGFFECVSDFVDSQRDRSANSSDRILLLKPACVETVKREQQAPMPPKLNIPLSSPRDNQNSLRLPPNNINPPIVDLSSFVLPDFYYKRIEYTPDKPFEGFLGSIEDLWNIHIGNVQFISQRDDMMERLQEHYRQSCNQPIYIIPFEQLAVNLACIYQHVDDRYYRSYILEIETTHHSDINVLKIYLVDYGLIISDINCHTNSTNLKFLHKDFSVLSTRVYKCRFANIYYPDGDTAWLDNVKEYVKELCPDSSFRVETIGNIDGVYCVNLWSHSNRERSINQLLLERGLAYEHDDYLDAQFQPVYPLEIPLNTKDTYSHIRDQDSLINNLEENNIKYYKISIEHAYYFVKHPYTKRPCLPCFEVARLLNNTESYISQLNLIRETDLSYSESQRTLFNDLRCLPESSKCLHINQKDDSATIKLYDLSCIRDYLIRIKFQEGDVIDAFQQEYDDYERPGYWNENKNSYINHENFQSTQENLYQRRDILHFRRDQLVSLSHAHQNVATENEIQEISQELDDIENKCHINKPMPSSSTVARSSSSTSNFQVSNRKMRETLFRIARPFDQQFSLNIRFNHRLITDDTMIDDDIEECFQDLYRITRNVVHFFTLESEISDEENRGLFQEADYLSSGLIDHQIPLHKRIETYNSCLQIIEHFQPILRSYVQRTDLLDTIY
ncbi:unnamed protein product [Adineta ricciae]|uniref:HTH OST-type domain-containing protein n=1 Tax=Adineta ricciae TaxID=249248 RepID=A0A815DFN2_ADIRI|nr:unnamed protein product [Adineta ricciae]CAF1300262.1 unnamed protein product [Adineta ricciae]